MLRDRLTFATNVKISVDKAVGKEMIKADRNAYPMLSSVIRN